MGFHAVLPTVPFFQPLTSVWPYLQVGRPAGRGFVSCWAVLPDARRPLEEQEIRMISISLTIGQRRSTRTSASDRTTTAVITNFSYCSTTQHLIECFFPVSYVSNEKHFGPAVPLQTKQCDGYSISRSTWMHLHENRDARPHTRTRTPSHMLHPFIGFP